MELYEKKVELLRALLELDYGITGAMAIFEGRDRCVTMETLEKVFKLGNITVEETFKAYFRDADIHEVIEAIKGMER